MKRFWMFLNLILIGAMILAACGQTPPTTSVVPTEAPTSLPSPTDVPEPTPIPVDDVLYLNLIWHQHQPLYYKNEEGIYTRPWVRVHATKDYYDMAAVVAEYPNVKVTFNITPVLMKQLDDYAAGAKDLYWVLAEKPASSLLEDEKRFILERFFDANWQNIIARFPRYQELLDLRDGTDTNAINAALTTFTEQDFRDLQIWFNLAWFDPDFLAVDPLKSLVEKGGNFSEEDKTILFDEALRIISQTIPLHKELQDKGQIEVITTPYAHPILPLIVDSSLAAVGNPTTDLPVKFSYPDDARYHLEKSVEMYVEHYGRDPRGLWPGEGSVAQAIVPMVAAAGYSWMATGEPVLAKSLGIDVFTRDGAETVKEVDDLYRPYYVTDELGNQVAVFFRDGVISDKVGFTYSGMEGKKAAEDFMQRLENIRQAIIEQQAGGPHVVSVVLDGENAWEYYKNDGKEFFHALYQLLSESTNIQTITPSDYLAKFPEQRKIDDLYPAAWFSPNYDTWIGEAEENMAWDYLGRVRNDLAQYDISKTKNTTPEALAKALDFMYLAEGSDWFWWYGTDQDSGQDSYFDQGYRALLRGVYESLGEPVPLFVDVPIIQAKPVGAAKPFGGLSSPVVDGTISEGEWSKAAVYPAVDSSPITEVAYAMDEENLFFKLTLGESLTAVERIGFYLFAPGAGGRISMARVEGDQPMVLLNMAASHLAEWNGGDTLTLFEPAEDQWEETGQVGVAAANGQDYEFSIPLASLGSFSVGDEIRFVVAAQPQNQILPLNGPGQIILPDLGKSTVFLEVEDPKNDDFGPGTYTYPTDNVFVPGTYDLKNFKVSYDEKNIFFKFSFYGPVMNPWGSPNNLAIHTLDVYVDKDPGAGTGARLLLPGRNAALTAENGWEFAFWAEGWTPQILAPDATTLEPKQLTELSFKILVDPAAQTVMLQVPKAVFGEGDPTQWGYAAVLLGQEGYPSPGVWRVRDISGKNEQWRFGGAPADSNHTRIIDMIWEAAGEQERMLSTYPANSGAVDSLGPDDFGQIELILP